MNRKTIFSAIIVLSLFTACDMAGDRSDWSPDGKASVRVMIAARALGGRTVMPNWDSVLQEVTTWQLLGGKQGVEETLLKEFSNNEEAVLTLETTTWRFTLNGYKGDDLILTGGITDKVIGTGTNTLEFTVAPVSEGQGTVNITINLPAESGITEARVFVDENELTSPLAPVDEQIVFAEPYDAGVYYFSIHLFKGGDLYGVVSEIVYVWTNLQSEKTYTLTNEDLNLTYTITYHLGDGETDFGYYQYTNAAVTLSASSRDGYAFKGWYDNEAFSGSAVDVIPANSTGNKDFYARWTEIAQAPSNYSLAQSLTWIASNAVDGGVYAVTINTNAAIAPQPLYYGGYNVSIILNGGTTERTVSLSSNGSLFTVESGVTLTLGANVTLQGRSNNIASLVRVNNGGMLVMNTGSKITGNTSSAYGGDPTYGGGVLVDSGGIFTMNGGEISNNIAEYGGGVSVYGGIFMMNNGTISNNKAVYNSDESFGGGVDVDNNGTFTMTGGTIRDNSADYGGGVDMYDGTWTMSGGIISGNTAATKGGGGVCRR
jgi:uncharacterized repeat protein (TIGR02543 family)